MTIPGEDHLPQPPIMLETLFKQSVSYSLLKFPIYLFHFSSYVVQTLKAEYEQFDGLFIKFSIESGFLEQGKYSVRRMSHVQLLIPLTIFTVPMIYQTIH